MYLRVCPWAPQMILTSGFAMDPEFLHIIPWLVFVVVAVWFFVLFFRIEVCIHYTVKIMVLAASV